MSIRATIALVVACTLAGLACSGDEGDEASSSETSTTESTPTNVESESPASSLALGTESTSSPSTTVADTEAASTTTVAGPATTEPSEPSTSTATSIATSTSTTLTPTTTTLSAVVDWSNVVPAEVVASLDDTRPDGARLRAWLLRFDDRLTLDVAQGMALEALSYDIVDSNGALELFAEGAWVGVCDECLDPDDVGGAATLMEVLLIGGYFGDYDPDPVAPDGTRLILRTFAGELGSEPTDQIEYLVGSARLGPMSGWEDRIAAELPELDPDEYLAAIAFEHACGSPPAGACG